MLIKRRKKYLLSAVTLLIVGLWLGGLFCFCHTINNYTITNDKTDAIVVLTGGRNRIAEAVKLFNAGLAEKLFISGVSKKVYVHDIENKIGVEVLYPERVELGYKAENTLGNASEIKEWIENNQISSVRLITSNYHMPRSMAELSTYHLPLKLICHPVYSEKVSKRWWHSWATFLFIFAEYNKFLFVKARNFIKSTGGRK